MLIVHKYEKEGKCKSLDALRWLTIVSIFSFCLYFVFVYTLQLYLHLYVFIPCICQPGVNIASKKAGELFEKDYEILSIENWIQDQRSWNN